MALTLTPTLTLTLPLTLTLTLTLTVARWHYSFLPIEGTSYMMALTVEETEVTATPDAMVARCNSRVS